MTDGAPSKTELLVDLLRAAVPADISIACHNWQVPDTVGNVADIVMEQGKFLNERKRRPSIQVVTNIIYSLWERLDEQEDLPCFVSQMTTLRTDSAIGGVVLLRGGAPSDWQSFVDRVTENRFTDNMPKHTGALYLEPPGVDPSALYAQLWLQEVVDKILAVPATENTPSRPTWWH